MDATTFRRQRDDLDLSLQECADVLGISKTTVAFWQAGTHRVPGWVDDKFKELRETRDATQNDRRVRRKIEDMYSDLSSTLYLGEVPSGWLSMVEEFLHDLDQLLPDDVKDGKHVSLHMKEKWGSLVLSTFLDTDDLELGERFWKFIDPKIDQLDEASKRICARCGSTDDVSITSSGWVLPLCRRHRLLRSGEL